ncbi:hypothetical protein WICMUC_001498 [Wickerhamomyces mucosus]|uniref:Pre-mRNA-processing protein PRP40 n=1 Tax=Wickerhamomyces mucosus TaxID=1378264 RepID=A0A9P8TGY7_9ASCO|nr:hypothetical protein WICMUC_001498 [Wickerhamomyces mucosus]
MWQQLKDDEGRSYYFNTSTNESSWEKPLELMSELEKILLKHGFKQFDNDGKSYYYNESTGESSWTIPENVQKEIDLSTKTNEENDKDDSKDKDIESKIIPIKPFDISKYHKQSSILHVKPQDDSKQLYEMFKEYKVDATWSFNQIIDSCIQDKKYWIFTDPNVKKQIFEDYLKSRSKEELLKENSSIEKFQKAFINHLNKMDIKYYTRWKTVKNLLINEPIYNLYFINESIKKKTFLDYRDELIKIHKTQTLELQNKAKLELKEYFKSLNININTNWNELLLKISKDKRFGQNKHFKSLNQLDLLTIYYDHIQIFQKDLIEKISKQNDINYRQDRKARDGFKDLLKELQNDSIINSETKWDDIYEFIEDDERFLTMLGRNGSTPFELFQDLILQENLVLNSLKDRIDEQLINSSFKITSHSIDQFEKFQTIVRTIPQLNISSETIQLIYNKFIKQYEFQQEQLKLSKQIEIKSKVQDFINEQVFKYEQVPDNLNQIQFPKWWNDLSNSSKVELQLTESKILLDIEKKIVKSKELREKKLKNIAELNNRKRNLNMNLPPIKQQKHDPVELDY